MKVPYVCCTKKFEDHYTSQSGAGLPFYRGVSFQKGYGLGSVISRLFRAAFPFLVKGTKTLGKEALLAGSRVASDVLSGQNLKESVKTRSKESGRNLTQKAVDRIQSMVGKGYKRKKKQTKRIISSKKRKVKGRDIFDP